MHINLRVHRKWKLNLRYNEADGTSAHVLPWYYFHLHGDNIF